MKGVSMLNATVNEGRIENGRSLHRALRLEHCEFGLPAFSATC
jgi:hypothetical protein